MPLLFTASYKANNHYMSKLDVESCFFVFILDFLPVIYVLQNYYYKKKGVYVHFVETVAQSCSVKKVFLEMSQNSKESTCARLSF